MIVVDASAMANMLVYPAEEGRKARRVLGQDIEWCAPEHWKLEVFSVLRGLTAGHKLPPADAEHAIERLPRLGVEDVGLYDLFEQMWQLRHAISAYGAAYVALAAKRASTLVTSDARLARAAMVHCRVELV